MNFLNNCIIYGAEHCLDKWNLERPDDVDVPDAPKEFPPLPPKEVDRCSGRKSGN